MKFYLPQVLLILRIMVLPKKVWNINKHKSKPSLGNSHLLKATEVFETLLPDHSQETLGGKKEKHGNLKRENKSPSFVLTFNDK